MQKDMALKEHIFNIIYDIARGTASGSGHRAHLCADIMPALNAEYSRYEVEKALESLLRAGRIEVQITDDDWTFKPCEK